MALELTFGADEWVDDVMLGAGGAVGLVSASTGKVVFVGERGVLDKAGVGSGEGLDEVDGSAVFAPDDLDGGDMTCAAVGAGGAVFVGDELGVVRCYGSASATNGKTLFTGAGAVVALAVAPDGVTVAACFGDSVIVAKGAERVSVDAAAASASWDPAGNSRLATLGDGGALKLFDVSLDTGADLVAECALEVSGGASQDALGGDNASGAMAFAWQPGKDREWLAAPGRSELTLLPASPKGLDWAADAQGVFPDDDQRAFFDGKIQRCAWSPSGAAVATVSLSHVVAVWDVKAGEPTAIYAADVRITALCLTRAFGADCLLLCSGDGALALAQVSAANADVEEDEEDEEGLPASRKRLVEAEAAEAGSDEDEDEMAPIRKRPKKVAFAENDSDDDLSNSPRPENEPDDDDDDVIEDADLDAPADAFGDDFPGAEDAEEAEQILPYSPTAAAPAHPPQPAFQVASTEAESEAAARYLHWSSCGAVTARAEEGGLEFAFEIEHYGENGRSKTTRFVDKRDFAVGSLGPRGALFATAGDEFAASQLHFRPLNAWSHEGGWSAVLPPGEQAAAVAVGDAFCACLTSRDLLRVYSLGGVEDAVVASLGRPVACCARKACLAVAYHRGQPTADGRQDVWVQVLDVGARSAVNGDGCKVPLAPGATLKWLGFKADDGVLLCYDSDGSFWMLVDDFGWRWAPALDAGVLRSNAGDGEWPVFAKHGAVHCAPLKGGLAGPSCRGARPVLDALPLKLPHASSAWDAAARAAESSIGAPTTLARQRARLAGARDALGRSALPTAADDDALRAETDALATAASDAILQRDRAVLRQLVAAAKEARYQRAYDLARRLELPASLDLALRIAESHGEDALSARVEDLVAFRDDLAAAVVDEEAEAAALAPPVEAAAVPLESNVLGRRSSNEPSPDKAAENDVAKAPVEDLAAGDFNPFKRKAATKVANAADLDAARFNY